MLPSCIKTSNRSCGAAAARCMSTAAPAGGKIAFIGLGAMGYHMAGHLATYGDAPPLTVWNRTRAVSDKPRPLLLPLSSGGSSGPPAGHARSC